MTEGITETECGETAGVKAEAAAGDEMTLETSAEIPGIDVIKNIKNMSMTENASTVWAKTTSKKTVRNPSNPLIFRGSR